MEAASNSKTGAEKVGGGLNTAASLGATIVTLSVRLNEHSPGCRMTGSSPGTGCMQFRPDFEHADVEVFAAAGDWGYESDEETPAGGLNFPAALPNVVAVGGTVLQRAPKTDRGWKETVWKHTGSGCSAFEEKPAWQTDSACSMRTGNDVAAVAENISYYVGEWFVINGTSLSTPLWAGIMAHANAYTRSLGPEAFYERPSMLFDVTKGTNGNCEKQYLCHAEVGYDGPTGWGTPDGIPNVPEP